MARSSAITEEQVFEAADALTTQGRDVTPTALLQELGSGSYTTIYKHLEAWRKSKASAVMDRSATIPDAALAAFGSMWRILSAEAGKEIAVIREQSSQEVQATTAKLDDAFRRIEELESEADLAAAKIETLSAEREEMDGRLLDLEKEKAGLKATAEQLNQRVKGQETELERVHSQADTERKKHQEESNRLNDESAQLKRQLEEALRSIDTVTRERDQAVSERDAASKRADRAEEDLQISKREVESAIKEAAELRGRSEAITAQNQDLLKRLTDKEAPESKKR